jgi:hypothetical protein
MDQSGNIKNIDAFLSLSLIDVVAKEPQTSTDTDKKQEAKPDGQAAPAPEQKNQSSEALASRAQTIGEDMGRSVAARSKLPANEQVIVRTAFSSEVKDGKAVISVDKGQLSRAGFTTVQMDTVTQGMYPDPAAPQKLRTVPMDEAQLNQYHEKFIVSVNRAIDQTV